MSSRIQRAKKEGLINPPKWLNDNIHYEVQMGSVAYGVSSDSSDMDIYGFCTPPKELVFPHLAGEISGFGQQIQRFEQYQEHHVKDKSARTEYDFSIYSIVKFFDLVMSNNPNMLDSLFVPQRCVLHITQVGQMVRDKRHIFLHKGSYHKFRGYAYSSLNKLENRKMREIPAAIERILEQIDRRDLYDAIIMEEHVDSIMNLESSDRKALFDYTDDLTKREVVALAHGMDTKYAYHIVRLALESEQILAESDLDLERSREVLKSIRRGEWSFEKITDWFQSKEKHLEELYNSSELRHKPDEAAIKQLLMDCLEHHYGTISKSVGRDAAVADVLRDMKSVMEKYGG